MVCLSGVQCTAPGQCPVYSAWSHRAPACLGHWTPLSKADTCHHVHLWGDLWRRCWPQWLGPVGLECLGLEATPCNIQLTKPESFFENPSVSRVTDCKSLYDSIMRCSCPAGLADKRCAVDIVITREALRRLCATPQWAPGELQLADLL